LQEYVISQIIGGILLLIASVVLIATTLQLERAIKNPDGEYNRIQSGSSVQENLLGRFGFKQAYGEDIFRDYTRQFIKYSDKVAAGVSVSYFLHKL